MNATSNAIAARPDAPAVRQAPSSIATAPVPVLVFGSFITGLGTVRAFGRLGIPAHVWAAADELPAYSRWYRPIPGALTCDNSREPSVELLQSILTSCSLERAVLVPCTDQWVDAVANLPEPLTRRFHSALPAPDTIRTLLDKGKLSNLLDTIGVPKPRTMLLRSPEDIDALREWDFTDAFLKPRSSQAFMVKFRVKGIRVANRAEAAARAVEFFRQGLEVLIQEYVPGPPTNHYFLDGYMDAQGKVRACFARKRLRMFPADFGNSTYMVSVPLDETGEARPQLEKLLRHVKYRGIFSAEFKKDARCGTFRLLEVNIRPWWYVEFAERSGVHVTDLVYREALGLPLRDYVKYEPGRRCVYPYFDYAAYRDSRRKGVDAPSFVSFAAAWLTATQPVFAWDDPRPALHTLRTQCQRLFKTHILKSPR